MINYISGGSERTASCGSNCLFYAGINICFTYRPSKRQTDKQRTSDHNVKILFSKTLRSNICKTIVYHEIAIFVLHITCDYKVLTYVEYRAVSGVFQTQDI